MSKTSDIEAAIHVWDAENGKLWVETAQGGERWYTTLHHGGLTVFFWFDTKEQAQAFACRINGGNPPPYGELLTAFVVHETAPCRYDHHGDCQEHGGRMLNGRCAVETSRAALGLVKP